MNYFKLVAFFKEIQLSDWLLSTEVCHIIERSHSPTKTRVKMNVQHLHIGDLIEFKSGWFYRHWAIYIGKTHIINLL